jgi:hypothetical protein
MKEILNKIIHILIYFFTPEDSQGQTRHGFIAFHVDRDNLNLGAAKAIFWLVNAIVFIYLLTLL